MALRLKPLLAAAALGWGLCCAWSALHSISMVAAEPAPKSTPTPAVSSAEDDETDLLGANAGCYVCHTTFVKEDLAKVHLQAKVGCIKCHGVSDKHANDENIGATKPDVTFKRPQIDANCAACHDTHDAPAKAIVARFLDRHLSAGTPPVCTDCHGTHKIDRSKAARIGP